MPIQYKRTEWYGFNYLRFFRGTVLVKVLPPVVLSSGISLLITNKYEPFDWCPREESGSANALFYHPFILGAITMVVGYITSSRFTISYQRFWDGIAQVKMMHSKWTDALIQILAFDRIEDPSKDLVGEPFCEHMVRLFTQLSALATLYLHGESFSEVEDKRR